MTDVLERRLALSTMLVLAVTGCAGARTALLPIGLPFYKQDPTGLDLRWRLARGSDQVQVDGLVTGASVQPVREAMLELRGLDAHGRVVSWTSHVAYWSDPSGDVRTQPFHVRLRPAGTEERFDVAVSRVDYYDWSG
jgi:hypothetical protein